MARSGSSSLTFKSMCHPRRGLEQFNVLCVRVYYENPISLVIPTAFLSEKRARLEKNIAINTSGWKSECVRKGLLIAMLCATGI